MRNHTQKMNVTYSYVTYSYDTADDIFTDGDMLGGAIHTTLLGLICPQQRARQAKVADRHLTVPARDHTFNH